MLICKAAVRRFILEEAANTRRLSDGKPRFTRVSRECFAEIEADLRVRIQQRVHALPSAGRTV